MVQVLGVRIDVGGSSGEDAERAERWSIDLLGEERAERDFERDPAPSRKIPSRCGRPSSSRTKAAICRS
jgi:hypothetical protein